MLEARRNKIKDLAYLSSLKCTVCPSRRRNAKTLHLKESLPLGEAVIHAVSNPLDRITAAIYVYGGDFFAVARSEWDSQTFEERPFDIEHAKEIFEEANKRWV